MSNLKKDLGYQTTKAVLVDLSGCVVFNATGLEVTNNVSNLLEAALSVCIGHSERKMHGQTWGTLAGDLQHALRRPQRLMTDAGR
jgi:hypothetical protein